LELEMAKAMQGAGDFSSSAGGSSSGSKSGSMLLAVRKKLMQTERALADKAQEVEVLKQDARVAKTSELEREKAVLLSEVKRLMQASSSMARCIADANTSLASLPEQAAMSSQNKTLQVTHIAGSASFFVSPRPCLYAPQTPVISCNLSPHTPPQQECSHLKKHLQECASNPSPAACVDQSHHHPFPLHFCNILRCICVPSHACIPASFL